MMIVGLGAVAVLVVVVALGAVAVDPDGPCRILLEREKTISP